MNPEYAHVISLIIFWSAVPATLVACKALADDWILRRVMLFVLLIETGLGVIVGLWWAALAILGAFLYQFIKYISIIDKQSHNIQAGSQPYAPNWARHAVNPQQIISKLDVAARGIGGTMLGTEKVRPGRHRPGRAALTAH